MASPEGDRPVTTIKVRMLTNIAGVPAYHSGDVVDLEDRIATAWIKDGLAAPHRAEPVERATK